MGAVLCAADCTTGVAVCGAVPRLNMTPPHAGAAAQMASAVARSVTHSVVDKLFGHATEFADGVNAVGDGGQVDAFAHVIGAGSLFMYPKGSLIEESIKNVDDCDGLFLCWFAGLIGVHGIGFG
jgi:hypothetical protein